jgi:hypothetical protein
MDGETPDGQHKIHSMEGICTKLAKIKHDAKSFFIILSSLLDYEYYVPVFHHHYYDRSLPVPFVNLKLLFFTFFKQDSIMQSQDK